MAANDYYHAVPTTDHHHMSSPGHPPHAHSPGHPVHAHSPGLPSPGYSPSSGHSSPLKPLHLVTNNMEAQIQHIDDIETLKEAQRDDDHLKARIRRLRVVSRILAFLISIGVLVPITLTLHKFMTTKDIFHDVVQPNGSVKNRTAWAKETKSWPTYMYFGVAAAAVFLNFIILFSYTFGVKTANAAATVATTFSWIVMIGNVVVWGVAAGLYRQQKDLNGKSNDLWGWTCSPGARAIQKEFSKEINFDSYCNIQSASWFAGLVQVGAALLTVFIYILVIQRRRGQKKLQRQTRSMVGGFEQFRG